MTAKRQLVCLLLGGFALRLAIAQAFPNIFWPDEIFQSLEQAHRLAFGSGVVPWEFREGSRSWLLPGFLAAVMWLTEPLGPGSSGYLMGVQATLVALSLLPVWATWAWARREGLSPGCATLAALVPLLWFDGLFFAPKALSETLAAHLLLPGLFLLRFNDDARPRIFLAGALLALAVLLRVHLAPAVAVASLWLTWKQWRVLRDLLLGTLPAIALAGLVDAVSWGTPFVSYWNNVYVNVVEGKSKNYGVDPWYQYFVWYGRIWTISCVFFLGLLILRWRARALFGVTALIVLASHMVIAHKEYRFVYPVSVLLSTAAGLIWAHRVAQERDRSRALLAAGGCAALILLSAHGASRLTVLNTEAYIGRSDVPEASHWNRYGDALEAFSHVSKMDDVCGIAALYVSWATSGGYTYLHHDVPWNGVYYSRAHMESDQRFESTYNVIITRNMSTFRDWQRDACFGEVCVFKRDGDCEAITEGLEINTLLITQGL